MKISLLYSTCPETRTNCENKRTFQIDSFTVIYLSRNENISFFFLLLEGSAQTRMDPNTGGPKTYGSVVRTTLARTIVSILITYHSRSSSWLAPPGPPRPGRHWSANWRVERTGPAARIWPPPPPHPAGAGWSPGPGPDRQPLLSPAAQPTHAPGPAGNYWGGDGHEINNLANVKSQSTVYE